jgi:hypothetical protein
MRNLLVCLAAFFIVAPGFGQDSVGSGRKFKLFKVDISGGYASPQSSSAGSSFSGGGLIAIEPQLSVIDPLAIGVRVEAALTAHLYKSNGNSNNSNGNANLSYLLTLDYYFTNTHFRPFIGGGGGIYTTAAIDSSTNNSGIGSIPSTSQFGFMGRAGFEWGHLRVAGEYNFVANNASYLGLKIGVCIGGGRKK